VMVSLVVGMELDNGGAVGCGSAGAVEGEQLLVDAIAPGRKVMQRVLARRIMLITMQRRYGSLHNGPMLTKR
jgi:hypothetical protein